MTLREKFLVEQILKLNQILEKNQYYEYKSIEKIHNEIREYIKKLSPNGEFIEELEDYKDQIRQKLNGMPDYLYKPFHEESKQWKKLERNKEEVERLTEIIDMLKKLLGEKRGKIIEEIDRLEIQKLVNSFTE